MGSVGSDRQKLDQLWEKGLVVGSSASAGSSRQSGQNGSDAPSGPLSARSGKPTFSEVYEDYTAKKTRPVTFRSQVSEIPPTPFSRAAASSLSAQKVLAKPSRMRSPEAA